MTKNESAVSAAEYLRGGPGVYQGRRSTLVRLTIQIGGDLLASLAEYHRGTNPEGNLQETCRELIAIALATDAQQVIFRAARNQAMRRVSLLVFPRVKAALGAIAAEIDALEATEEASGGLP